MVSEEPIAFVGMGGIFPGPDQGIEALWEDVIAGRSRVSEPPPGRWTLPADAVWAEGTWKVDRVTSRRACFVSDEAIPRHDPGIALELWERLDPGVRLVVGAARQAWESASLGDVDRGRVAVILGSIALPTERSSEAARASLAGPLFDAFESSAGIPNGSLPRPRLARSGEVVGAGPCMVARALGLGGIAYGIDAACASSLFAIAHAVRELRARRCDLALAGGYARADALYTQMGFSALGAISKTGRCTPFDRDADGLVVGEGAGVVVLERLSDAIANRRNILGVVRGIGLSNDVAGSLLAPAREGQLRAMNLAYVMAGWAPHSVELIECHATGTPTGDRVEHESLRSLWGGSKWRSGQCVIGSVKSVTGHLLTGAGAVGVIKVLLALRHGALPPTSGFHAPAPGLELESGPFRVLRQSEPWLRGPEHSRRAAISGFGFGGTNAHLLVEGWEGDTAAAASVSVPVRATRRIPVAIAGMASGTGTGAIEFRHGVHRVPPRELSAAVPQQLRALQQASEAWRDAELPADIDLERVGVFVGSDLDPAATRFHLRWWIRSIADDLGRACGIIDQDKLERIVRGLADAASPPLDADRTLGGLGSIAASRISRDHRFGGPSMLLAGEGDPGELALQVATHALEEGEIDAAIVVSVRPEQDCNAQVLVRATDRRPRLAFVFPGSGAHYPRMGQQIFDRWPHIAARRPGVELLLKAELLAREDPAAMAKDPRNLIMAHVALGMLVSDVLRSCGLEPDAGLGHSVGETTSLLALGFWPEIAELSRRIDDSSLFISDLCGRCDAARQAWGIADDVPVAWVTGLLAGPVSRVRAACAERDRVYLLLVNSPDECVVGGDAAAVDALVRELGLSLVPIHGVVTVHCSIAAQVEDQYREFHRMPTRENPAISIYGGEEGRPYSPTSERAAESITSQALRGSDFSAMVERAWQDGVRVFVEVGPGGSCTRLIGRILGSRPHLAVAACAPGRDSPEHLLDLVKRCKTALQPARTTPQPAAPDLVVHPPALDLQAARALGSELRSRPSPHHGSSAITSALLLAAEAQRSAHEAYLRGTHALMALAVGAPSARERRPIAFDRALCLEFATGSVARVLGDRFAPIDAFPSRVRLPAEPLMLVDRIVSLQGEPCSMSSGTIVTEHDVAAEAWYLDGGRMATSVAIEAGQADLFLSAWLGIDFETQGRAMYRLLDATVTFSSDLPGPGAVVSYEIAIERFLRQGNTWLFRFSFEATVAGRPFFSMRDGCAGFFTPQELADGQGIVQPRLAIARTDAITADHWVPPVASTRGSTTLDEGCLDALRDGDLVKAFGPSFRALRIAMPLTIPGGRLRLVHRVVELDVQGGTFGRGSARTETDIRGDEWFLACHFVGDEVMPGTLMYECALQTLRVLLLRQGWVPDAEHGESWQPVLGISSRLRCRGQVLANTRVVSFAVDIEKVVWKPDFCVIARATMYADSRCIVEIVDMSVRIAGCDLERMRERWSSTAEFESDALLEFADGAPSRCFGPAYRAFDADRRLARLPRPPYLCIDRILRIEGEALQLRADTRCSAELGLGPDRWWSGEGGGPWVPFAVLMEAALQPCGFTAAWGGCALTSAQDLRFRNLGGEGQILRRVDASASLLRTEVTCTQVAKTGAMIVLHFDFEVSDDAGPVYRGRTHFGFFDDLALAAQVGLRDAPVLGTVSREGPRFPTGAPFPSDRMRMIDRVMHEPGKAANGRDRVSASIDVDPEAWFFAAHFRDDPVWPGSLGLEAFLQVLVAYAAKRWGVREGTRWAMPLTSSPHRWTYRGQILPTAGRVDLRADIIEIDDARRRVVADGWLAVDGLTIYSMQQFALEWDQ